MAKSDIGVLFRKRGSINAKLTNFCTFIKNLIEKESPNAEDYVQLNQRFIKIEVWLEEFDLIQSEIESISQKVKEEYATREKYENTYYEAIAKAKSMLNKLQEESDVASSEHSRFERRDYGVRLPKIELPKFNGSYSYWLEYRDTFESLIHSQRNISEIQKFHYLRASLDGEALKVIQSLEFTSINYEVAWKSLLDRYDNHKILISNHVRAIFNLEPIIKESSSGLRTIVDDCSKNLRALEQLKQPIEKWDTLIVYLITTKLDMSTLKEWENHTKEIVSPNLEDMKNFLSARAALLETLQITQLERKTKGDKSQRFVRGLLTVDDNMKKDTKCDFCTESHYIQNCGQFLKLNVNERVEATRRLKLCLNCLHSGHVTKFCRRGTCKKCNLKHHTLLHYERQNDVNKNQENIKGKNDSNSMIGDSNSMIVDGKISMISQLENNYVLLSTAFVQVLNKNKRPITIRALLDSGSQASYITESLCDKLQLESSKEKISICGLNGMSSDIASKCELTMSSISSNYSATFSCLVISKITGNLPSFILNSFDFKIPPNIKLADPHFYKSQPIDMLIGADLFWNLLCVGQISLGKNNPILQKTQLGWIVAGPLRASRMGQTACNLGRIDVESQLARFWEIEEINKDRVLSDEEKACEEHFIANFKRKSDGRFVIKIPFKRSAKALGDSYCQAERRFIKLEQKLENKPDLRDQYVEFMREYFRLGHMSPVGDHSCEDNCYYIPHHCVIKEDSLTTKLRVVFDASATSSSGYSLNNLQMSGPTIQNSLLSILLRFRQHAYVIAGDIEKMYRQIEVDQEDRKLQRILWRENKGEDLKVYELNTVTYGMTSASFLAVRCLFQLAEENKEKHPQLSEVIKNDFYVDDMLSGADTIDEAARIANGVHEIVKQGCFPLRKFYSNNEQVLSNLNVEENGTHKILKFGKHENAKTLGLNWCPNSDILSYDISVANLKSNINKRTILSEISQIFDPLGLVSPCTINAKILLQHLWLQRLTWDESLPLQTHEFWCRFRRELPFLNKLNIQRFVSCDHPKTIELHAFADASERAYGACIYLRVLDKRGRFTSNLLCAKSKVAPLKSVSLPRLELSAALVAARLAEVVLSSLRLKFDAKIFWSDSTVVLGWLKMQPRFLKTFVSNRVSEIQQLTEGNQWRHIPGKDNPADILSRGIMPKDIANNKVWWEGPSWLLSNQEKWPKHIESDHSILPEVKENVQTFITREKINLVDLNRFSKLSRLKNTIAYVYRFLKNCKSKVRPRNCSPPNAVELDEAMKFLIRQAQEDSFSKEIQYLSQNRPLKRSSKLLSLNPYLDDQGILRVGGRIENSKHPVERKHPIILDSRHHLTELIFKHEHEQFLHIGPQQLLATIREKYWPITGRILAKKTFRKCIKCHKANPRLMSITPGQLPETRLLTHSVFNVVGVDYAGPIMIRDRRGRGAKLSKSYIALFICFSTKAIHLEAVSDLSAECFLMSVRRFVSRRGIPSQIYSDNGRNFVAASKELTSFLLDSSERIQTDCSRLGIEWHFIPPYSPHFGGIWEAGVKCCKTHLKRVVGNAHMSFEELTTLLVQIEAILNSRPILPLSNHPDDLLPLTPAHFLIGRPLTAIPDLDLKDVSINRLTRFQHIQQCQQHFWQRWQREYLSELQKTFKKFHGHSDLKEGMLVLIKEENTSPLKWKLGRITKVFPGRDGLSRVAALKTMDGEVKRCFAKLAPLPMDK